MQIPFNQIYFNNEPTFDAVYKKINELVKGDKFMAEIIDIKADTVTLRLNDNSTLQAKSLVLPEAKIGERVVFAVKDNSDGVVQLEFVKNQADTVPESFVNGILNKFEIPINKENGEVIKLLINNDIELSQKNVDKAMFLKYSDSNISSDKLLFLLEEGIPLEKNTVSILNGIMDKSLSLKNNILELCEELIGSKDSEVAKDIFKLLDIEPNLYEQKPLNNIKEISRDSLELANMSDLSAKKNNIANPNEDNLKRLFKEISDKLFIRLENKEELKKISKKIEQLYKIAQKGEEINADKNESLAKALQNIKSNIEFSREISEYKSYMQIPFSLGENTKGECELYVFKNPKGNKKINGDNASMLLGLDMAYLGRIEAYIQKNGKSLSLQIKAEKENSLRLMKKSFLALDSALKEKGYSISEVSFKLLEEAFNVTKKAITNDATNKNNDIKKKRFSFDMRI